MSGQEMIALHSELLYTALHAAADFGKHLIVESIIRRGYSLDMLDPKLGQTALHFAAWAGRVEVVKRLLMAGTFCNEQMMMGIMRSMMIVMMSMMIVMMSMMIVMMSMMMVIIVMMIMMVMKRNFLSTNSYECSYTSPIDLIPRRSNLQP